MGGLPRRRVSAFSIMKFMGGTTLDKIAPLTSWISQPYSVNKFIRSMLIWSAVLRLSVSMDARNFSVFSRSNSPTEILELPISMAKSIYVLLPAASLIAVIIPRGEPLDKGTHARKSPRQAGEIYMYTV